MHEVSDLTSVYCVNRRIRRGRTGSGERRLDWRLNGRESHRNLASLNELVISRNVCGEKEEEGNMGERDGKCGHFTLFDRLIKI